FFFTLYAHHPNLHSFPTRRSSDLKIVDHTANHGKDNRIWSRSLYQRRDLYVYLPPGYDPSQRYPLILWLHGFTQDEQSFPNLVRSEEHTSELQSLTNLVCRLLLEK